MIEQTEIRDARILVVDDNPENVELLVTVLAMDGYTSVSATTASTEVAAMHAQDQYDLILLDMQMPGANGLDVIEALQKIETNAYIPVLAITANPSYKNAALRAGARDFLTKPFDLVELHQRIRNFLEVRLLYKRLAEQGRIQSHMALHDPLTGLPNRRLLEDRMAKALHHARRNEEVMAILYLDLDGFKGINDQYGHGFGDRMLKLLADRLRAVSRQQDTVARIGGDEFILLLAGLNALDDVVLPAKKILDAAAMPFEVEGLQLAVTASIGIALFPVDGDTVGELTSRADAALYDAKRAGRNRFQLTRDPSGNPSTVSGHPARSSAVLPT